MKNMASKLSVLLRILMHIKRDLLTGFWRTVSLNFEKKKEGNQNQLCSCHICVIYLHRVKAIFLRDPFDGIVRIDIDRRFHWLVSADEITPCWLTPRVFIKKIIYDTQLEKKGGSTSKLLAVFNGFVWHLI